MIRTHTLAIMGRCSHHCRWGQFREQNVIEMQLVDSQGEELTLRFVQVTVITPDEPVDCPEDPYEISCTLPLRLEMARYTFQE